MSDLKFSPLFEGQLNAPTARFSLFIEGRSGEVETFWVRLKKQNYVLILRFDHENWAGDWIVTSGDFGYSKGENPMIWQNPARRSRKLQSLAENAIKARDLKLARVFYALQTAPLSHFLITSDGNGVWLDENGRSQAVFEVSSPDFDGVLHPWNDETSKVRFAWNWAQMSENERQELLFGGPKGWHAAQKLCELMEKILTSAPELWARNDDWEWHLENLASRSSCYSSIVRVDCSRNLDFEIKRDAPRLERWQRLIPELFVPLLQTELQKNHLCVERWFETALPSFSVRVESPPSAHQQLEAHLWVRDWVRRNLSKARWKWFLPS